MAEDDDVNIQPITRADFVPAKVFRSRSMNTLTGMQLLPGFTVGVTGNFLNYRCFVLYKGLLDRTSVDDHTPVS